MKRVLLADDDHVFVNLASNIIAQNGFDVKVAMNKMKVLKFLEEEEFDIFLLDLNFPNKLTGKEILQHTLHRFPELPIVMISGDASIEGALEAVRQGAVDFLEKPINKERLLLTINNVLEKSEIKKEVLETRKQAINMIGSSVPMQKLYNQIIMVSQSDFPVLIYGETGSGKDLVASAIHNLSKRSKEAYIEFNCGAIPHELWESELFGHKKGSFTGASEDKKGYLCLADKGSIFMDEIASIPIEIQPKLLRFLENGSIQQVGSQIQEVDVRIISATNIKLEDLVKTGDFREDLQFRLNVLQIDVPPLREHKEDIPDLAKAFINKNCLEEDVEFKDLSPSAMQRLLDHSWKGNIRELKNIIARALIYSPGKIIDEGAIDRAFQGKVIAKKRTLKEASAEFEKEFIKNNLALNDWNVAQTAQKISIERSNLYKKIKHHKIKILKD